MPGRVRRLTDVDEASEAELISGPYHAAPTDIVALLCIRSAKSGGLSAYEDHPEPERRRNLIRRWLDA
jgi:hypothetical protein